MDALTKEIEELSEIQESSTKLLNLYVADLLCLAQIDQGTFRKNEARFNVKTAIDEIMRIQADKVEAKALSLTSEFRGFDEGEFQICTDPMRLQQVLLNYQSNAIKFTPDGGSITIFCSLLRGNPPDADFVEVQVVDSGIGISEEDQQKLFQLFGYIEHVRESMNTQGIGMGLHITKSIVDQFHGKVSVHSQPGHGSTFTFSFRLASREVVNNQQMR